MAPRWMLAKQKLCLMLPLLLLLSPPGPRSSRPSAGFAAAQESDTSDEDEEKSRIPDWHLVDVPLLQCHGGVVKELVFNISLDNMPSSQLDTPHIVTFFRTTQKAVSVHFEAKDNWDSTIVPSNVVELIPVDARRRLEESADTEHGTGSASDAYDRRLLFRRSFFGASVRTVKGTTRGRNKLRVRGSSGVTGGGAMRSGVTRIRGWRNTNNPAAMTYGLAYGAGMGSAFPNGHEDTDYGYAGTIDFEVADETDFRQYHHGHVASEGDEKEDGPVFVNLSLPELAHSISRSAFGKDTVESELLTSRWATFSSTPLGDKCNNGDTWSGSCSECYKKFGSDSCATPWEPPKKLTRDNLMRTGFIPSELESPLRITIYEVHGEDLSSDRICAPKGWKPNEDDGGNAKTQWSPPDHQDLFITITEVEQAEDEAIDPSGEPVFQWYYSVLCGCVLCSCVTFVCAVMRVMKPTVEPTGEDYQNARPVGQE